MIRELGVGQARVGAAAAEALGLSKGDRIEVRGHQFEVHEVLPAEGDLDDYRLFVPLEAVQAMLGQTGQVNALLAFMCLSHGETLDELEAYQSRTLQRVAPEMRHHSRRDIAEGRFAARSATENSLGWLLTLVLGAAVVVIAATGLQEVWERRKEVGIFAAMGTGQSYIAALYLVRMALIAAVAACIGFLVGSLLAVRITTPFLSVETNPVQILWGNLPQVLALTVLVALVSGLAPMAQLLRLDPNETLTEE
jgi:ABC-type lipoprotein release transport system permease subunit